jgi:hypothetical protein
MATTVTHAVDPDGGAGHDYDSLSLWNAGEQGDLTGVRDEIAVAKCQCTGGTADTTAVTIDGWTTSATQYIKIWTDPTESYRHNGTYQTGNKYRLSGVLLLKEGNARFDGIQSVSTKVDNSNLYPFQLDNTAEVFNFFATNSIFKSSDGESYLGWIYGILVYPGGAAGSAYTIINCIFDGFRSADTSDSAGCMCADDAAGTFYIYNCTFNNCNRGVWQYSGTVYCKNCIANSCPQGGFAGTTNTNCASSDGTADDTGSGNRVNQTFSFVSASDFHLASNDAGALGYGLNLYNDAVYPFQIDIDGQDRGGAAASWDIGADEYVSSAAIDQEGFRFRNDDGSESAATWKANQDTNITLAANTAFRLRELLNAIGDPASINAQLEVRYKPSGGAFGSYVKVVN